MTKTFKFIFIIFIVAYSFGQTKKLFAQNESWYLIDYIDSTVIKKQIYNYSGGCASYAYKIEIDESKMDSASFIGYHEAWKDKLFKIGKNTYKMGDDSQYWKIIIDSCRLTIQEFFRDNDTTKNVFTKHKEIPPLQQFFSEKLLTGKYINEADGSVIKFNTDFTTNGIGSFVKYQIIIDFWDYGNGMDGIYLYTKNGGFEEYHWWFEDKKLHLKKIQGAYETNDGWKDVELVGKTMILRKIE